MAPVFLHAEWRDLILVNFQVDPEKVAPFLPPGTEPELIDNAAFLSMVGFQFLKTRVLGIPVFFHAQFPEVNLRTYVKGRVDGREQSGVVFLRELVPRSLVSLVARWGYGEPYRTVPLTHERAPLSASETRMAFQWAERGERCGFHVTRTQEPVEHPERDERLVNHLWGFGRRNGKTLAYEVHRPVWRLTKAKNYVWTGAPSPLLGTPWHDLLLQDPVSIIHADGSPISVSFPREVTL